MVVILKTPLNLTDTSFEPMMLEAVYTFTPLISYTSLDNLFAGEIRSKVVPTVTGSTPIIIIPHTVPNITITLFQHKRFKTLLTFMLRCFLFATE